MQDRIYKKKKEISMQFKTALQIDLGHSSYCINKHTERVNQIRRRHCEWAKEKVKESRKDIASRFFIASRASFGGLARAGALTAALRACLPAMLRATALKRHARAPRSQK